MVMLRFLLLFLGRLVNCCMVSGVRMVGEVVSVVCWCVLMNC